MNHVGHVGFAMYAGHRHWLGEKVHLLTLLLYNTYNPTETAGMRFLACWVCTLPLRRGRRPGRMVPASAAPDPTAPRAPDNGMKPVWDAHRGPGEPLTLCHLIRQPHPKPRMSALRRCQSGFYRSLSPFSPAGRNARAVPGPSPASGRVSDHRTPTDRIIGPSDKRGSDQKPNESRPYHPSRPV